MTADLDKSEMLSQVLQLCRTAGKAIADLYDAPEAVKINYKADFSPLTEADTKAHDEYEQFKVQQRSLIEAQAEQDNLRTLQAIADQQEGKAEKKP